MRSLLTFGLLISALVPIATGGSDGGSDFLIGSDGETLKVAGSRQEPGTQADTSSARSNPAEPNTTPSRPPQRPTFDACLANWDSMITCFRERQTPDPADPAAPEEPALPPITMNDLATFAPEPVTTVGEPGNVGVAGMPTNFVATATVHTRTGMLFGLPITVRFTPSGYDFHYGDGSDASIETGGATWAALGQAQFTPTATSHVFAERGSYLVDVDVRYTAEIDLGLGWFAVAGELTTDGPLQEIRVFEAHTALVAHTCAQTPSSPGC